MATKIEELKYKLYKKRHDLLFLYGAKKGLIRMYDDELLDNLRHVYYGGIPVTILLLHRSLCDGHCYDRGPLVTLGFGDDDFQVVDAEINNIKLNPKYIDQFKAGKLGVGFGEHCFAERTFKDGTTWVYDTSIGLVIEKNLYYKIENPKVRIVNNKNRTLEYLYKDFQKDSNIENDKYVLPLILPNLEANLEPVQDFYMDQLMEEFRILKEELDYDGICNEIHNDMKSKRYFK